MRCSCLKSALRHWVLVVPIFLPLFIHAQTLLAEEVQEGGVPDRYALALTIGNTYDPSNDIAFGMVTGFALYDYDKIWPHAAPENLRFKVEFSMGSTLTPNTDFMASAGILALYYIHPLSKKGFRPYIEGGIGLIYTGFRFEGQGLHLNFNPQMGIGAEFKFGSKSTYFSSLRLSHLSNAGLDDHNRGVNSVVLHVGLFF